MKSKTSCFNRRTHTLRRTSRILWPLWLLYQIYLLVVIPVWVWQKAASAYYYLLERGTRTQPTACISWWSWRVLHRMVRFPLPVFFFAVAAALAVFSYLYSAKSVNMMHALPVEPAGTLC